MQLNAVVRSQMQRHRGNRGIGQASGGSMAPGGGAGELKIDGETCRAEPVGTYGQCLPCLFAMGAVGEEQTSTERNILCATGCWRWGICERCRSGSAAGCGARSSVCHPVDGARHGRPIEKR